MKGKGKQKTFSSYSDREQTAYKHGLAQGTRETRRAIQMMEDHVAELRLKCDTMTLERKKEKRFFQKMSGMLRFIMSIPPQPEDMHDETYK
jgi:hypothetical protein